MDYSLGVMRIGQVAARDATGEVAREYELGLDHYATSNSGVFRAFSTNGKKRSVSHVAQNWRLGGVVRGGVPDWEVPGEVAP